MDKRVWTDAEVALLREKYPTYGSKIPGLDRPAHHITRKANALGLRLDESVEFRGVRYDTLPAACEAFGVAYSSVSTYKKKAGVTAEQALEYFVNGGSKAPPWQSWEDDVIREEYSSHGSNIARLSHRSSSAIVARAIKLGIKCDRFQKFWSKEDIQLLRKHYEDGCDIGSLIEKFGSGDVHRKSLKLGLETSSTLRWESWEDALVTEKYKELGSNIPELRGRRSSQAIVSRAAKLGVAGVASTPWSDEELNILREKYPTCGTNIPELSTRTAFSIRGKACELGILCIGFRPWTEEQIELLKTQYPVKGFAIPELQAVFTEAQIKSKANTLHLRMNSTPDVWTEEEDAILRSKYPAQGSDIPELVGRDGTSIGKRAKRLGIKYNGRVSWTVEQEAIVREKYPLLGPDIPELLGTFSKDRIMKKANSLGIKRKGRNVPWTAEEERIIADNYDKMTAETLLTLLPGRTLAVFMLTSISEVW